MELKRCTRTSLALAMVIIALVSLFFLPSVLWTDHDDVSVLSKKQRTHQSLSLKFQMSSMNQGSSMRVERKDTRMRSTHVHSVSTGLPHPKSVEQTLHQSPEETTQIYSPEQTPISYDLSVKTNCSISGTFCDCSDLGWTTVPQDLPNICITLLLDKNYVVDIANGSFIKYPALEVLSLQKNKISTLHAGSFQGLSRLQHLNLRDNILPMLKGVFPNGLFKPLRSLLSLDISKNNEHPHNRSLNYPDQILKELRTLVELRMDGLRGKTLGNGFRELKSLRNLTLAGYSKGYCDLHILTNETFLNVKDLEILDISECYIYGQDVDSGAFAMFQNLQMLDLSWNGMFGYNNLVRVMEAWKNKNLSALNIGHIRSAYASLSRRITKRDVAIFPNTLEDLEARGNGIEIVDDDVFANLPKFLKVLDVSENRFLLGCYLKNMSQLENLERLVVNGGDAVYSLPKYYPPAENDTGEPLSYVSRYTDDCSSFGNDSLVFYLPPKLKSLSMRNAGLRFNLNEVHVDPNNSLEHLSLNGNNFPRLEGPIYGLNDLKNLSFNDCRVQWISYYFFQNLTSLRYLDLGGNIIGLYMSDINIFKELTNLQYLNLSFNAFHVIRPHLFDGLDKLKYLYLQKNLLWEFHAQMSHMTNLWVFNLSQSSLTNLNLPIRHHIDWLTKTFPGQITVDLSDSSITCRCEDLDFLEWMASSWALNKSLFEEKYGCVSENVFYNVTDGYAETIKKLKRECASNYVVFLLTLGGTLILASGVLGLILYRFRWNLRYMYYAAYLNLKKGRVSRGTSDQFQFDTFISYTSEDEDFILDSVCLELEQRGVTLLVHGRDFTAGEYIASNIVTAVQKSRKTLVVLTRALLRSTWCKYELQMANMESVHTGRPVLVFLLKESIPSRELGTELLYHIRSNTYIPYPQSCGDQETDQNLMTKFWDKLASDLRD